MRITSFYRSMAAVSVCTALAALFSPKAQADECDYVGRHHKTDVEVISATTYPASRTGDIDIPATLTVKLKNSGVNAFTTAVPEGGIFSARRLALAVKGQILYGWMNTPLNPGDETRVNFSLPDGLIGTCERITIDVDANNALGQWGCMVRANDSLTFQARMGSRFMCVIPGPIIRSPEGATDLSSGTEISAEQMQRD